MAKILIIIPHDGFRDEEFSTVNEILRNSGHEISVGSTHHTESRGHFGLLVKPDVNISYAEVTDYDCYVFIGGRGVDEFKYDNHIHNLIKDAFSEQILLAAIGMAVEIFIEAGIMTGRKLTCNSTTIELAEGAGAYYSGRLVQMDGEIITASGVSAKEAFAKEIIGALKWRESRKGPLR